MKTAIIDNGIDKETLLLYDCQPAHFSVSGGKVILTTPAEKLTHGGICSRVFAMYTGVLPDISISLTRDKEGRSDVQDLTIALEWCLYNDVGLVNLSMGTPCNIDATVVEKTCEKLAAAGITVVTSASNVGRVTYPAALPSCIGVCQALFSKIGKDQFVYLKQPFDGIEVVTAAIKVPKLLIHGSNSISTAFITGTIYNKFKGNNKVEVGTVRKWLAATSQKTSMRWEEIHLLKKLAVIKTYEPIILYFSECSDKKTYALINHLQELILQDGYTCAILTTKGESNISHYQFSLTKSPSSPQKSLKFITGFCKPDIILLNVLELESLADVLVIEENIYHQIHPNTALVFKYGSITAETLWIAVKNRFDPSKDI